MSPADSSPSDSESLSADAAARRFSAARMPIDDPVEDPEAAVERLRQCSSAALRRARKHHRRALESLNTGGYSALSEATRERLADRLRTNLKALNCALDARSSPEPAESEAPASPRSDESSPSLSAWIRSFFWGLG